MNGTGDLTLRWEVARVALRTPDQLCNCLGPVLSPARMRGIELLIGGKRNHPRRLCSSRQRRVFRHLLRLIPSWSLVPYGTASGKPASTTDQNPALESAGLYGPVESGYPMLPSFLGKLGGACRRLCALSKSPAQVIGPSFIFMQLEKHVNGENQLEKRIH